MKLGLVLPETCLTFYEPKALQIHIVGTEEADEFYEDNYDSLSPKESVDTPNSSWLLSLSQLEEQEKSTYENILQFDEEDPNFDKTSILSVSCANHSDKAALLDKETILTVETSRCVGDAETTGHTKNQKCLCMYRVSFDNVKSERNETHLAKPKTEIKVDMVDHTVQPNKDGNEVMHQAPGDMALLNTLATNGIDESKNEWENLSQQRADALES
ncbi:hypothetical protein ACH5RR_002640 [Cinchona calisaya]|uniref:Uncharacterized protein n=1 Tax=Cinchona calisaya TaxID=153742 RepID=A0ABD3ASJ4_9GENT